MDHNQQNTQNYQSSSHDKNVVKDQQIQEDQHKNLEKNILDYREYQDVRYSKEFQNMINYQNDTSKNNQAIQQNKVEFRLATLEDVAWLNYTNNSNNPDQWDTDKFVRLFEYNIPIWIVTVNGERAGLASYLMCLSEGRILSFVVDKRFQKNGYGRLLLKKVLEEIRKQDAKYVMLEVRVSNFKALHLYTNFGFRIIRTQKGYYTDYPAEDGYLMHLELDEFFESNPNRLLEV